MTTKKYKKLLMSCGIERNLAEEMRARQARIRRFNTLIADSNMANYMDSAESEIRHCNGSIRVRKKRIRIALKKAMEALI